MKTKVFVLFTLLIFLASVQMTAEGVKVTPYGIVRLSSAYETGCSFPNMPAAWAVSEADTDGLFHMSANESRFGLKVSGPTIGDYKVTGLFELDFVLGGSETKSKPRMRHAYVKLSNGKTTFLAGQTWDIINPKFPRTVNLIPLWASGNMGFRRPQIRVEQKFSNMIFQAGLFASLDLDIDGDGIDDGKASGTPTVQARLAGMFDLGETAKLELGVSGHYGKTKSFYGDSNKSWDTYSLNVDVTLALCPSVKLVSEFFTGQNLAEYWGGIKQGINVALDREITSKGFYTSLQFAASKKVDLSVGYGMDNPDDEDLNTGNRSKNTSMHANVWYKLHPSFKLGFEALNFKTEYLNAGDFKTTRLGFLVMFIF